MNWDDLRIFLAIAHHGSLTAAGRALRLTQSTMGRRLEALEERMGARLLQRTPGGFRLTDLGEAVLANAERIEEQALQIERTIAGRDVRPEGTVRITAVETLAVELLMPILADFRRSYPGIVLDLITDARSLSLTKREADVALRLARIDQHDLRVRKVAEMAIGVYASADYLARQGMPDFADGARGHYRILPQLELRELPDVVWFDSLSHRADLVLSSNSRYAQRAACQQGLGLTSLPRYLGDPAGLVRLPTPQPPPVREVWLAVHADIVHAARIRALTDFVAAGLKAKAAVLAPPD